jgi:hypothetical protein
MFHVLFGMGFVCMGLYALSAVFMPRWRSGWRGTHVMAGAITHLGFGLAFTGAGAILMFAQDNRDLVVLPIAGPPMVIGVPLVLIGYWLDFRRAGKSGS